MVDDPPGVGTLGAGAVATHRTLSHEVTQVAHLVERLTRRAGRARERRQRRGDELEVERQLTTERGGRFDGARVAGEAARHLGPRAQVGAGVGRQPRVELVEAAAGADRRHRGGQRPRRRRGVVDVGGAHDRQVVAGGELGEGVVAMAVERVAVVPQLDRHPVTAEQGDEAAQLAGGGTRPVSHQRGGHGALAAPGEHVHVAGRLGGERVEVEPRRALLARQLPVADRRRQARVPRRPVGEQEHVLPRRVGLPRHEACGRLALPAGGRPAPLAFWRHQRLLYVHW